IRDFHVTGVQTCALPISKYIGTIKGDENISAGGYINSGWWMPTSDFSASDNSYPFTGAKRCMLLTYEENDCIVQLIYVFGASSRSEERRVGKECRSRWAA